MKPKVAFFDFTSCEGCQLNKLNLENDLLDILKHIDIVEFREAMDDKADEYDIAFIEGSISSPSCVERIHDIRRRTKILVALVAEIPKSVAWGTICTMIGIAQNPKLRNMAVVH